MREHRGVLIVGIAVTIVSLWGEAAFGQASRGVAGDAAAARQPQKWAIVIGVGAYQDAGLADLPKAVNDARAVRDALVSMEDGFPKDNVVLLSDDAGPDRQPTRSNIIRYVSSYLKLAGSDDTTLVYFAGHGMTEGDQLHLLPHDATLSNVGLTGYPFAELERTLREAKARRKVLILDACHSGTGRASATLSGAAVKELERAAEGMVTLASCSAEELSHEMPDTDHGAFTHFLLEALAGEADRDGDGYVSAHEASVYTWDATRRWAASQGLAQTPWRRDEGAGEILLAKVRVIQGSPRPPRAHEVRPPVAEPDPELEVKPPAAEPKPEPEPEPEPEERPSAAEQKRAPGERRSVDLGGGVRLELAWVPSGEFLMGSNLSPDRVAAMYGGDDSDKALFEDEHPQHQVRISRGFWMGVKEVTNRDFGRFVEETGYQTEAEREGRGRVYRLGAGWEDTPGASWRKPGWETKPEEPVVLVSWNDAKAYCGWLAKKTGDACRLPSEAEWEYACRAGATTEFWWGDRMEDGAGKVNGADQTRLPNGSPWSRGFPFADGYWRTAPVGSSAPNAWGLYDMHGNVWEWCEDWYATYTSGVAIAPRGPAMGLNCVSRGGSWYDYSGFCRSAFRNGDPPKDRNSFLGFRVALPGVR